MKLKIYGDKLANAMAENALLKFCLILLTGITLFNAIVAYRAMNNQKVVILPPMVDHKIAIRGNKIIEEVIRLRVSSSFHIHTIKKLGSTNRIELVGLRSKHADDVRIESAIEHHFIEYDIDEGTFRVTGVSQKNGA